MEPVSKAVSGARAACKAACVVAADVETGFGTGAGPAMHWIRTGNKEKGESRRAALTMRGRRWLAG